MCHHPPSLGPDPIETTQLETLTSIIIIVMTIASVLAIIAAIKIAWDMLRSDN